VGIIEGKIASFFDAGHSFNNLFYDTPLCWLNYDQIYLDPNYDQSYVWAGLAAEYSLLNCPDDKPYGESWMLLNIPELLA